MVGERGTHWLKIKQDFWSQLGEHLDAVIVGAYYGQGKRQGYFGSFLVAIRNSSGEMPPYITVAKFGTGFDNDQLLFLCNKLTPHSQLASETEIPSWLLTTGLEKPDVYIHPEKSLIVEVKCTEMIPSTQFASLITMRFPRMKRIREDKSLNDILTIDGKYLLIIRILKFA